MINHSGVNQRPEEINTPSEKRKANKGDIENDLTKKKLKPIPCNVSFEARIAAGVVAIIILIIILAVAASTNNGDSDDSTEIMVANGEKYLNFTDLDCQAYSTCNLVLESYTYPILYENPTRTEFVETEEYPDCVRSIYGLLPENSIEDIMLSLARSSKCPYMLGAVVIEHLSSNSQVSAVTGLLINEASSEDTLFIVNTNQDKNTVQFRTADGFLLSATDDVGDSVDVSEESSEKIQEFLVRGDSTGNVLFQVYGTELYLCKNETTILTSNLETFGSKCEFQIGKLNYDSVEPSIPIPFLNKPPAPTPAPIPPQTLSPTPAPTGSPSSSPTAADKLKGSKPNIVMLMLDDLGYHDVGWAQDARQEIKDATPFLTSLLEESILLERHYAHWHCSPSRRSFLSGRLPHRTEEDLSFVQEDHMDVRWTLISEKLKLAGYSNYYFGKAHTGFKSTNHLPANRGFDEFMGFLVGKEVYTKFPYWKNNYGGFVENNQYSTHFFTVEAIDSLKRHEIEKPGEPFFLFLSYQTPHTPIESPGTYSRYSSFAKYSQRSKFPFEYMIFSADYESQVLVEYLKSSNQWNNTLFIFASDNGATSKTVPGSATVGSNYPLRGEKSSSFEAAMRVQAFVSGGIVPKPLRGTKNKLISHFVDWYASFCYLADVNSTDAPPNPIPERDQLPDDIDPQSPSMINPSTGELDNIWASNGDVYPDHDSVNIIPYLFNPGPDVEVKGYHPEERDALVISKEAIIKGDYKLVLAQPCAVDAAQNSQGCKNNKKYGWLMADDKESSYEPPPIGQGCTKINNPFGAPIVFEPCLFNLETDPDERSPIINDAIQNDLWKALNDSLVYQYNTQLLNKENGVSRESDLGACQSSGNANFFGVSDSPICGLNLCGKSGTTISC